MTKTYRTDIDGLRAIAVLSVILFHLGYLSNGFLGVDVFFVISGYLITGLVYKEVEHNKFSILRFYERRIRRIVPLVLFTTFTAFAIGMLVMLPNDLENLCQAVIASNFSANNILMFITSADYWALNNDYKPLMHTWSLGIEEQFYLLYPVIFFFLKGDRKRFILPLLWTLTLLSLGAYLLSEDVSSKFYFLQYRFYELSIGGICAISFDKNKTSGKRIINNQYLLFGFLAILIVILAFDPIGNHDLKVILTTLLTAGILVMGGQHFESNGTYKMLLSNKLFAGIGKISFSLYMWHQLVFAFTRYFVTESITPPYAVAASVLVVILSVITYYFIESPFRNRERVKTKALLVTVALSLCIITGSSLYVYVLGGFVRDVPELGISLADRPRQLVLFSSTNNINIQYNEDIRKLDMPFSTDAGKTNHRFTPVKVLVLGNSFSRDVANVLLESSFSDSLEIRYSDLNQKSDEELRTRIAAADFIFFGGDYPTEKMIRFYKMDMTKVWIVGTKNFGVSNGIHYNRKIADYTTYRTPIKPGILEDNELLKKEWGNRLIDLIDLIGASQGMTLVFTPEGKFISQDTVHFTKYGAAYFARLLQPRLQEILQLHSTIK